MEMDSAVSKSPQNSVSGGEEDELKEVGSPVSPRSEQQRKFTRFLVEEILKPEFGLGFGGGRIHRGCARLERRDSLTRSEEEESDAEALDYSDDKGGPDREAIGMSRVWPAWVYCTRYSDRPSSGPRVRKSKKSPKNPDKDNGKRPRTSFTNEQLKNLKQEFEINRYLNEERRQKLAKELDLNESQVKIWFQNKRAKAKKGSHHVSNTDTQNNLAVRLMAEGLYNHSVRVTMNRKQ